MKTDAHVQLLALVLSAAGAAAQSTTRVSVSSSGAQGNQDSTSSCVSADGRYVAFLSKASTLVANDTFGYEDVFVHDRVSGQTVRVSVNASGIQADAISRSVSISGTGRYVAFGSQATNLVPGGTNGADNIFVHDRDADGDGIFDEPGAIAVVLVSGIPSGGQSNGGSIDPSISADGRFVAFMSTATNLVPGDTNSSPDVFVHDRDADGDGIFDEPGAIAVARASVSTTGVQGNSWSIDPVMSADGRHVAFMSVATSLVPGDTGTYEDVLVRDLSTGVTTCVSMSTAGVLGNGHCSKASISTDGRFVAFDSQATNLATGAGKVFVRDRDVDGDGILDEPGAVATLVVDGSLESYGPSMSADGRRVAFWSFSGLVAGDTNGMLDVYVRDRMAGTITLVSQSSAGVLGNGASQDPAISADGRFVSYWSQADNLVPGDTNTFKDVLLRDLGAVGPTPFCFGDGIASACPCGNSGASGRGCNNSAATGGALLSAAGTTSPDTIVLTSAGELPTALSIFLQGNVWIGAVGFGDGLRCIGGSLKRLYVKNASAGTVSAPGMGDPSITMESTILGDPIAPGSTRYYQTYYRDPNLGFCPSPSGNSWNVSNGMAVVW